MLLFEKLVARQPRQTVFTLDGSSAVPLPLLVSITCEFYKTSVQFSENWKHFGFDKSLFSKISVPPGTFKAKFGFKTSTFKIFRLQVSEFQSELFRSSPTFPTNNMPQLREYYMYKCPNWFFTGLGTMNFEGY